MEDSRWLRLITIGLVLAAIAVGYFLFTGRFSSNTFLKPKPQVSQSVLNATSSAKPAIFVPSPSPSPVSAYNKITERTAQGSQPVQTLSQSLPRTGFPAGLSAVLTVSLMIFGWGLRKFPH